MSNLTLYPVRSAHYSVHQLFEAIRATSLPLSTICRKAKVHHDVIGRWRRGEATPNVKTLDRVWKVVREAPQRFGPRTPPPPPQQ